VVSAEGATPLRSGDILRMSEFGPDLRFAIVAEARPRPVRNKPSAVAPAARSSDANRSTLDNDDDDDDDDISPAMFRPVTAPSTAWPVVIIATAVAILVAGFLILQNYLDER